MYLHANAKLGLAGRLALVSAIAVMQPTYYQSTGQVSPA